MFPIGKLEVSMVQMVAITSPETQQRRETTLKWFFEGLDGFIRMAIIDRNSEEHRFQEFYFQWPQQRDEVFTQIGRWVTGYDIYFSPMLFVKPIGKKEHVKTTPVVYSDLDSCEPENLLVKPHMVVQTSTGRFQAFWRLDRTDYNPVEVEDMARRVAYTHQEQGADKSGWDLTQLLRLPFTLNHKYAPSQYIKILEAEPGSVTLEEMGEVYTQATATETGDYEYPAPTDLPTVETLMVVYHNRLYANVLRLIDTVPDENDWSAALWRLMMELFEIGMTREECFVMCREAQCNKFARDGRSEMYLWRDICRAWVRFAQARRPVTGTLEEMQLLTQEELASAEADKGFVEEYIEWASSLGDAAVQYHEAGAFVILSSLLAGNVRLPTSYGVLNPNVWFMILADTTLTRKTTAMDLAMDLVVDVDPDAILATDGSIEGLFTGIAGRPGRPSVFLRDEFSGLIEQMTKKDYYAGMAETLTKLYDGKYQKRILRRETIEVKEPILILFAGGIRNRILTLLTWEHVASGFLPRFIFITAESDPTKLQPLGPPTDRTMGRRDYILTKLRSLHSYYTSQQMIEVNGKHVPIQQKFDATLTEEAWERYRTIEATMLKAGVMSPMPDLSTPTMDRLCKSGLKIATLIAATRKHHNPVVIELQDIIKAFFYIDKWRGYTAEVLDKIGETAEEKEMMRIHSYISTHPGCLRSEVMQRFAMNARKADVVLITLEQRDLITRNKTGRGERLVAFQYNEGKKHAV